MHNSYKIYPLLCFIELSLLVVPSSVSQAEDWPMFRGPGGSSVSADADLPLEWSVEDGTNIAWEADLPGRGVSGPIVVDGKVIITASSGPKRDRLHVLAFDAVDGKQLWHRKFWATGRTLVHPVSAVAAPTPASDGSRIFAFFSSNDVVALDLDGNLLWLRALGLEHPGAGNDVGMSSSPVVSGDVVVVQSEGQGNAFVTAMDTQSGETRWELDRKKQSNWASPIALEVEDAGTLQPAILLQSTYGIGLHRADNGELLWEMKAEIENIPSLAYDNYLYVPSDGIQVVDFASLKTGEETLVWSEGKLQPSSPSPVVIDENVYTINRAGVLNCGSLAEKKITWRERLGGTFWATPVAAGGHLYCVNSTGKCFVVAADPKQGKLVSEIDFGEEVLGSPAIADDALFVRSHEHLWKIAK